MSTSSQLDISLSITDKFQPFLEPKRYKVAYGGRGSGKSYTVAQLLVLRAIQQPSRILCAREIQKSISDSVLQLLADTIERMGLTQFFDVQKTQILGKNGSRFLFEGLRSNITKIKSMEGIDIVWVEEAESVTYSSWETLIPTIRKEGSEIWVVFNPDDELDDTYRRFITEPPPNCYSVKVNWSDNPFFPAVLEQERLHLLRSNKEMYDHVWDGNCYSNRDGSYYAKVIQPQQCREFEVEPKLPVHSAWDLGMSDSTAIWLFQYSPAGQMRFVHCYEAHGEGLQHYINYLHGWRDRNQVVFGKHIAPHDIRVRELGSGKSRFEIAQSMGITFDIAPSISLEDGIQAVRTMLPVAWFNSDPERGCLDGLRAIRRYRKEFDESKGVYKSHPLHDASSHYADAIRYAATGFTPPVKHNSRDLMPDYFED